MRLLIATAAVVLAAAGPSFAKGNPQMKVCAANWKTAPHTGTTYKAFMATCLSSSSAAAPAPMAKVAPAPTPAMRAPPAPPASTPVPAAAAMASASGAPAGATAKCKDGSYSLSKHHSGSCSHHGGVASYL